MNKIYMKASMVEDIVDSNKGTIDSNSILTLEDGKRYQLNIAIKFLDKIRDENNFHKLIFSLNDLEIRNYTLYSSLGYVHGEGMLRNNYLFDSEVDANGQTYKVIVGYLGVLLDGENDFSSNPIDLIPVFKEEHNTIKTYLNNLKENIYKENIDLIKIQSSLNTLFDFVTNHLDKEDLFLYPDSFTIEKLQEINERESKKMKKIHSDFLNYYEKWEDKINMDNFDEFKSETELITKVLVERIEFEENEILINF